MRNITFSLYIYNLLLFPTVKKFQHRLTVDEVIARSSTPRETQCIIAEKLNKIKHKTAN